MCVCSSRLEVGFMWLWLFCCVTAVLVLFITVVVVVHTVAQPDKTMSPPTHFLPTVPRGWWSRYRAHVREQKYPLELETFQEFEQHAEYLASAYTVYITESNFQMFWNEKDSKGELFFYCWILFFSEV